MRKLRFWSVNFAYLLMSVTVAISAAQPSTCSALVAQALSTVDTNCTDLGRNNVCYGYNRVDATFFDTVEEGFFSAPADRADLTALASIQTAPLDLENDQWGVAVMNVQANVPNTLPGQAVTFILLGDSRIENAVPPTEAFVAGEPERVIITAFEQINVRSGPGTNFNIVSNANPGQLFDVDARNETGDWFRISGQPPYEWINRSLFVTQSGSNTRLNALPVAPETPISPMQAFYFRTGVGVPTCMEAPDMLVVQGPKNVRVSLTVNGAEVALGSTIAFQSGETSLGELRNDARIGSLFDDATAPDESICLFTEMSVLEGDALADSGGLFVPLGHWAKSATCLDEERSPAFTTPFGGLREMTEAELAEFSPLENINFPHYPLEIPSRDAILQSVQNGPSIKPEPTRLPIIELIRPTQRPASTVVPNATPAGDGAASCGNFAPISPTDQANSDIQNFSWNPAHNVVAYQLEISASDSVNTVPGSKRLYRTGSENTNIEVNLNADFSSFGQGGILWKVQALIRDEQGNLITLCESPYRYSRTPVSVGV